MKSLRFYYETVKEAQEKIKSWTTPPAKPVEPVWKVVWP
jgi:hypothetical protein